MKEKMKLERIIDTLKYGSIGVGKKIIVPSISFAMGYGLGELGKYTNHHEISIVPVAMDLFSGCAGKKHVIPYLFYGAGIATSYFSEIFQFLQNL